MCSTTEAATGRRAVDPFRQVARKLGVRIAGSAAFDPEARSDAALADRVARSGRAGRRARRRRLRGAPGWSRPSARGSGTAPRSWSATRSPSTRRTSSATDRTGRARHLRRHGRRAAHRAPAYRRGPARSLRDVGVDRRRRARGRAGDGARAAAIARSDGTRASVLARLQRQQRARTASSAASGSTATAT